MFIIYFIKIFPPSYFLYNNLFIRIINVFTIANCWFFNNVSYAQDQHVESFKVLNKDYINSKKKESKHESSFKVLNKDDINSKN